jgi:hypothetical protein
MKRLLCALVLPLSCVSILGEPQSTERTIPCKTAETAPSCRWIHGRLAEANGNPSYRLWKVGTHRLLGIYSGPEAFHRRFEKSEYAPDNEAPQLPSNVEEALWRSASGSWANIIFADFEVCPLEKEKPKAMQSACIESAKNIVIEKGD